MSGQSVETESTSDDALEHLCNAARAYAAEIDNLDGFKVDRAVAQLNVLKRAAIRYASSSDHGG